VLQLAQASGNGRRRSLVWHLERSTETEYKRNSNEETCTCCEATKQTKEPSYLNIVRKTAGWWTTDISPIVPACHQPEKLSWIYWGKH